MADGMSDWPIKAGPRSQTGLPAREGTLSVEIIVDAVIQAVDQVMRPEFKELRSWMEERSMAWSGGAETPDHQPLDRMFIQGAALQRGPTEYSELAARPSLGAQYGLDIIQNSNGLSQQGGESDRGDQDSASAVALHHTSVVKQVPLPWVHKASAGPTDAGDIQSQTQRAAPAAKGDITTNSTGRSLRTSIRAGSAFSLLEAITRGIRADAKNPDSCNRAMSKHRERIWEERMTQYLRRFADKRRKRLQAKGPPNCLARFVRSGPFTALVATLILLNGISIGFEIEDSMDRAIGGLDEAKPDLFVALNIAFSTFFVLELFLTMLALRSSFFIGKEWAWNMFDLTIVCLSTWDILSEPDKGVSHAYARILRFMRVTRVLRICRVLRFFRAMRCMVMSIVSSVASLAWAFIFLFFIVYVFAIVVMQAGVNEIQSSNEHVRLWEKWYGSLGTTMYTLIKSISGGESWGEPAIPMVEASVFYQILFVMFVLFVVFGVVNVFVGVFLQQALESMLKDRDYVTQAETIKMESFVSHLAELFAELDLDHSGELSWQEFVEAMENPRTQALFTWNDLDLTDAHIVFNLIATQHGTVDTVDFIKGCTRARGFAKSAHIMTMMQELAWMREDTAKSLKALQNLVGTTATNLSKQVHGLRAKLELDHGTVRGDCDAFQIEV